MKKAFWYLMLILLPVFMFSSVCPAADVKASDYYEIVKKLRTHDVAVDYKTLRMAYTLTPDYNPYGTEAYKTRDAAYNALNRKDYKEAVRLAESLLEKNYVDLDAHLICRLAYKELNNILKYGFHTGVLRGLVNTLYASGDGTSPEKAIAVIAVREEYFLLNANGLKKIKQSLMNVNGKRYDKMEVEVKKTGEKKTLYFNVDIPFGWLSRNMEKK
jgi:hypothetical protein